jgi:hypothetical protein
MVTLSVRAATVVAVAAFIGALTTARVASQQRRHELLPLDSTC